MFSTSSWSCLSLNLLFQLACFRTCAVLRPLQISFLKMLSQLHASEPALSYGHRRSCFSSSWDARRPRPQNCTHLGSSNSTRSCEGPFQPWVTLLQCTVLSSTMQEWQPGSFFRPKLPGEFEYSRICSIASSAPLCTRLLRT